MTHLIAAKCCVAPLKSTSIPRIELAGALLASRLLTFIKDECRLKFACTYLFTDSQIVFSMIQQESYGFATFTVVRVGEIQENMNPSDWFWINGEDNVADYVTHGKSPSELLQSGIWQRSPDFLRLEESEWPISQPIS